MLHNGFSSDHFCIKNQKILKTFMMSWIVYGRPPPSVRTEATEQASKRRRTLLFGTGAGNNATKTKTCAVGSATKSTLTQIHVTSPPRPPPPIPTHRNKQPVTAVRDIRELGDATSVIRLATATTTTSAIFITANDFFTQEDDGQQEDQSRLALVLHIAANDNCGTATFTMPLLRTEWSDVGAASVSKTKALLSTIIFGDVGSEIFCFGGKTVLKHLFDNGWIPETDACTPQCACARVRVCVRVRVSSFFSLPPALPPSPAPFPSPQTM